ncbi:HAD family hydrolase [Couchioplanes caeruleus]|uniref:Uncharacterized protein n=2 Tax=Couchioplanes caeruleus TaxID=56438 RepID=A0A1K0GZX3_9ACTN|nr:hypothetical protein [Couchioplanes caeruleus]OJF14979.1 hypothetical protein BG844_06930 [Couchioplanes caeruleus subsp. caeruleus]
MLARLMLPAVLAASALTIPAAAPAVAAPAAAPVAAVPDAAAPAVCDRPVVYFDLGNVLIDTSDWSNVRYEPGALSYLRDLRSRGVDLGLIINIPETWGATQEEKLATMKQYIADRWVEPRPFVWSYFEGRIVLPRTDAERKPAPVLFERALTESAPCVPYYQGEVAAELSAAAQVGLRTYQVGRPGRPFYLPASQVRRR